MIECPFCNLSLVEATKIYSYEHWNLFLQAEDKRRKTKGAAGFVATKEHEACPIRISNEAWLELKSILDDATESLCKYAGFNYVGSVTVGYNYGQYAGQIVEHTHVHILPSVEEAPVELRYRGGMGAHSKN